jgi:hypothetical protein
MLVKHYHAIIWFTSSSCIKIVNLIYSLRPLIHVFDMMYLDSKTYLDTSYKRHILVIGGSMYNIKIIWLKCISYEVFNGIFFVIYIIH